MKFAPRAEILKLARAEMKTFAMSNQGQRIDSYLLSEMMMKASEVVVDHIYTEDDAENDLLERKANETNEPSGT